MYEEIPNEVIIDFMKIINSPFLVEVNIAYTK